ACHFAHPREQRGAKTLLLTQKSLIVDTDGIDDQVRLFDEVLNIMLAVVAVIVTSIRDDQQRPSGILCLIELMHCQTNTIQERRTPLGHDRAELTLESTQRIGEVSS